MSQDLDFTGYNFNRPKQVAVSYFTENEMIVFAACRNRVQLDDGRKATLIRWTTPQRRSQARLQFLNGNFLTVNKKRVIAVEVEPITESTEQ